MAMSSPNIVILPVVAPRATITVLQAGIILGSVQKLLRSLSLTANVNNTTNAA